MHELHEFIHDATLVAHNASFDKKFLIQEGIRAGINFSDQFLCTMLLSRRLYPAAINHKLSTLADYLKIGIDGSFHRALFDAEITAQLFVRLIETIKTRGKIHHVPSNILHILQSTQASGAAYHRINQLPRLLSSIQTKHPRSEDVNCKTFIRSDFAKEGI